MQESIALVGWVSTSGSPFRNRCKRRIEVPDRDSSRAQAAQS